MIFTLDIYEWILNFMFLGMGVAIWSLGISASISLVLYTYKQSIKYMR